MRPSHKVMLASIRALVIRDIQKRFILSVNTNRSFGFLWLFIEPLMHIFIMGGARLFYGIKAPGLSTPLFLLLGVIPFLFIRAIISSSVNSIKGNKNLYNFRQILPIDVSIAWWISQILILSIVTSTLFFLMYVFDISITLFNPMQAMTFLSLFLFFCLGLSLIFSVLGFFFHFFKKFMIVIKRSLFLFSGVFFPAASVPAVVRPYFLANPLFQTIEGLRESFMNGSSLLVYADLKYMAIISTTTFFVGLFSYFAFRIRIMTRIQEL